MPIQTVTFNVAQLSPWVRPELAVMEAFRFAPNLTVRMGDRLAYDGTQYANTGAMILRDGTHPAIGVSRYDFTTDATGRVTLGLTGATNEWGATDAEQTVFLTGFFRTSDFVNVLLAAELTELLGVLIQGTLANGVINF